jgi:glycosyltransferase involved in cell wall biosynthesis
MIMYKIAVVTPYYRIEPEKLKRCCDSVSAQTYECDHILVADGEPQEIPDGKNIIHMTLPGNVGNSGASPRGFGAQYAFVQGYDAVAFLDADNWYDEDHIELAITKLEKNNLDVVFARRHIIFPDGEILTQDDPEDKDAKHVDTNCYIFSKRAAFMMVIWSMYPKEFGAGEDRLMRIMISARKLNYELLDKKTIWYETNWKRHYRMGGKKEILPLRSPKNFISKSWDKKLMQMRTGLF